MNLSALMLRVVDEAPERTALIFEGRAFSYADLWARSGDAAARLMRAGVRPGDRVGLLLPNVPAFPAAFFGALRLGAIAVPLNPAMTADELAVMLSDAGVGVLVTVDPVERRLEPAVRALATDVVVLDEDGGSALPDVTIDVSPRPVSPETPAVIVFSSGTTGRPKGVTLSHGNIVSNVRVNAAEVGMTPADRVILFMPLFHCYGLNVIMNSALSVGATVVLERRFAPRQSAETIARERVTMFFGVPTMFIVLLQYDAPEALASLRWCYCAAAPLPLEVEQRWRARTGLIVNQAYGLSEAAPCVTYNHIREYRPGSIGVPSAGVELRVVDPGTGHDVAEGAVGELWVRSPGVMLGYWGRPEATAAVMRDGWLRTGDLGRRDADGYYFITDRLKDMIICGGMKVYPTEVENALYRHPAVGEAAVIGVPDATMGEAVHACVAPKAGARLDPDELRAFVARRLAAYKRPTTVRIVDALPKGRTGKILRRVIRAEARAQTAARPATPARRWSQRALRDWIIDWVRLEGAVADAVHIAPDGTFVEAGVDSLLAVRQAAALSALLGRPVPATVTWLHPTPERLAAHLVGGASGAAEQPSPRAARRTPALDAIAALSEAEAEAQLLDELAALEGSGAARMAQRPERGR